MHEQLGVGTIELMKTVGSGIKSSICQLTTQYVSDIKLYAEEAGVPVKYVHGARASFKIARLIYLKYDLATASPLYHRKICQKLSKVIECFFLRISSARSGQVATKMKTFRELTLAHHEIYTVWYVDFPEHCQEAAKIWPDWYQSLLDKKKLKKFEVNVVAAVESKLSGEDKLKSERLRRRKVATARYRGTLRGNRERWRNGSVSNSMLKNARYEEKPLQDQAELKLLEELEGSEDDLTEDDVAEPQENILHLKLEPPSLKFVFKVVKDLGYSWSCKVHPTECPIHDKGPCTAEHEKSGEVLRQAQTRWEIAKEHMKKCKSGSPEMSSAVLDESDARGKCESCIMTARCTCDT